MGTGFTGISCWILSIRLDPFHPVIRLMRRAGRFRLTEAAEIGSLSVKFAHPAPAPLNVVGKSSIRKRSLAVAYFRPQSRRSTARALLASASPNQAKAAAARIRFVLTVMSPAGDQGRVG
jgi:hypothetical protein